MTEVNGEGFAPHTKVSNIEDGQIFGQGEYNRLAIVATQRILFAILVGNAQTLGCWTLTASYPELGICIK